MFYRKPAVKNFIKFKEKYTDPLFSKAAGLFTEKDTAADVLEQILTEQRFYSCFT